MFRNLKIQYKMLLGFSVPMLLMLIVACVVYINVVKMIETANWDKHTQEVIADARELGKLIVDMETGERGFLITGKEIFLGPFKEAQKVWDKKIMNLKKLVRDNSEQIVQIEVIDGLAKQWLKDAAQPEIAARIKSNKNGVAMNNVINMVNARTGKKIIDKLRVKLDNLIEVEADLLKIRSLKSKSAAANTIITTIVGTILAIILALFSALKVSNTIAGKLKVLVERTREISIGTIPGKIRIKSDDEIGALSSAFNDMAQQLSERENALRQSEERFRVIFNQAAIGVAQIDTKTGQFVRVNQRYCDIVGYSQEEMTSTTFMKITHLDDLKADMDNMQKLVEGKIQDFSINKRYYHKDGSIVWVNLTVSPMWNIGEQPNYHIAVVEDITDRKLSVEKREALLKKLQKALSEIKTLSGLLPICASCKKIRDDKGYWKQIEGYIQDHSEAEFSHSICPECIKKLYPELQKDD